MRGTLAKIQPLHAEKIPPTGAVAAGVSEHGKQLYRLSRRRSRAIPDVNDDGEQKYRRNLTTGEKLYPLYRPEIYTEELLFWLESDGQGNIYMTPYLPPTAEQLAERERNSRIAAMRDEISAALVDAGISPQELIVAALAARAREQEHMAEVVREEEEAELVALEEEKPTFLADFSEYPKNVGPGIWDLSDGTRIGGGGSNALKRAEAEVEEGQVQLERFERIAAARAVAHDHAESIPEV